MSKRKEEEAREIKRDKGEEKEREKGKRRRRQCSADERVSNLRNIT